MKKHPLNVWLASILVVATFVLCKYLLESHVLFPLRTTADHHWTATRDMSFNEEVVVSDFKEPLQWRNRENLPSRVDQAGKYLLAAKKTGEVIRPIELSQLPSISSAPDHMVYLYQVRGDDPPLKVLRYGRSGVLCSFIKTQSDLNQKIPKRSPEVECPGPYKVIGKNTVSKESMGWIAIEFPKSDLARLGRFASTESRWLILVN